MNKHQISESKSRFQKQMVILENQIKKLEKKQMQKLANIKEADGIDLPNFKLSTVNQYASQILNKIKEIDPGITVSSNAKFEPVIPDVMNDEPGTQAWSVGEGEDESNYAIISDKKMNGSGFENNVLLDITVQGKPIFFSGINV